jgi:hypothetical protein
MQAEGATGEGDVLGGAEAFVGEDVQGLGELAAGEGGPEGTGVRRVEVFDAQEAGEGGGEVSDGDGHFDAMSFGEDAGPAPDHGNLEFLAVGAVAVEKRAMLAEGFAMIAEEDDEGVGGIEGGVESFEELADLGIVVGDFAVVEGAEMGQIAGGG